MDQYNVLSISYNLDDLNKDIYNWGLLPKNLRIESDNKCKELYGCTNRELYNKIKAKILLNSNDDNTITLVNNESYDYSSIDRGDLVYRIGLAKSLNNDILTSIIYPYDPELISDPSYKDSYKSEFFNLYNKFLKLSDKYQMFSNSYSIQLFGYNVRSMYQLIYPDIADDNKSFDRDYLDSSYSAVEESLTENLVDRNIVELYKYKIYSCNSTNNRASTDDVFARMLLNEVNHCISTDTFENNVNSVVPYFTLSEFNSIIDNTDIETLDSIDFSSITNSRDYYKIITELYDRFTTCKDDKEKKLIENTLLSIAWNPYVNPRKYMSKVRDRQIKWFNEHSCKIVDLSNINIDEDISINESSTYMEDLYRELDIHPVYIILTYNNTPFSKIIRKVKGSTFTHAGITLNSDLKTILTFMFNTETKKGGFSLESLDYYLDIYKDMSLDVLCLFVDSQTLKRLNDNITYFIKNKNKTNYNFKNLINILRNKEKDNDPYNLSMVCSQFVDTILKLSGINLFDKSSNLVIPQDFEDINNPKVYKLYNGFGKLYNETVLEAKIKLILSTKNTKDIRYNAITQISTYNLFKHKYNIIDNSIANKYLRELYEFIKPTPIRSLSNTYVSPESTPDDGLIL